MTARYQVTGDGSVESCAVLTVQSVAGLWTIIDAAQRGARVARLIDDIVYEGVARYIGDQQGYYIAPGVDVRDAYLRVTTLSGFETFWPVADLMHEAKTGEFAVRDGGH